MNFSSKHFEFKKKLAVFQDSIISLSRKGYRYIKWNQNNSETIGEVKGELNFSATVSAGFRTAK